MDNRNHRSYHIFMGALFNLAKNHYPFRVCSVQRHTIIYFIFLSHVNLIIMKYIAAKKGGRVWQGSGRGVGQNIHYVPAMPETTGGCWLDNALCGTKTGLRSYGWDNSEYPVNCPKCLKKYQSLNTPSVSE